MRRALGTMVAYGFSGLPFRIDLDLALRMGATVLEILPDWEARPDPAPCRAMAGDAGLAIQGAHGAWGRRSMSGVRVDLGSSDPAARSDSVDEIRRCLDWIAAAGGTGLVVHPGGLSAPEDFDRRRQALRTSLVELADHVAGGGPTVLVENMPPGVHPGSNMSDLRSLLDELNRPELGLTLDTGHARLVSSAESETRAAGRRLGSLHVHDNDGAADLHWPPGLGTIDWRAWVADLDEIEYGGPILLECVRHIRRDPSVLSRSFLTLMADLTGDPAVALARDAAPA